MANGNQPAYREVDAASVLRLFAGQKITVTTGKPGKKKGEDGVERDVMIVKEAELAPEHVLSAKQWADSRVTITTVDGKRYEAKGAVAAASARAEAK